MFIEAPNIELGQDHESHSCIIFLAQQSPGGEGHVRGMSNTSKGSTMETKESKNEPICELKGCEMELNWGKKDPQRTQRTTE